MILYKKVTEKKASYSGVCMETKNVYIVTTMQNNGLDFKNTPGYIKYTNA